MKMLKLYNFFHELAESSQIDSSGILNLLSNIFESRSQLKKNSTLWKEIAIVRSLRKLSSDNCEVVRYLLSNLAENYHYCLWLKNIFLRESFLSLQNIQLSDHTSSFLCQLKRFLFGISLCDDTFLIPLLPNPLHLVDLASGNNVPTKKRSPLEDDRNSMIVYMKCQMLINCFPIFIQQYRSNINDAFKSNGCLFWFQHLIQCFCFFLSVFHQKNHLSMQKAYQLNTLWNYKYDKLIKESLIQWLSLCNEEEKLLLLIIFPFIVFIFIKTLQLNNFLLKFYFFFLKSIGK
jgi:hypothetical protein